jgi:TRAP-type mannitol/chloroaromatic compound transport system substrate-binding protein
VKLKRRQILGRAGAGLAGATLLAGASASAQEGASGTTRVLKLVSDYPEKSSSFKATKRFADLVSRLSAGRLKIEAYGAGQFVRAFESFDAVAKGLADMYVSAEFYYAEGRSPAYHFFTSVPFGLRAREFNAWIDHGDGQQLWDELAAGFNIKPFYIANAGIQMGGWFKKPPQSMDDLRGLRYRIPGLASLVLEKFGVITVNLPASDILPALQAGALDAVEWVGPASDLSLGFQSIAPYYVYPGWHEAGGVTSLGINLDLWHSLDPVDQELLAFASRESNAYVLSYYDYHNPVVLDQMEHGGGVTLAAFPQEMLDAFARTSETVLADIVAGDALAQKVYKSFKTFREQANRWSNVTDSPFLAARARIFS